jgi:hypothetical protein
MINNHKDTQTVWQSFIDTWMNGYKNSRHTNTHTHWCTQTHGHIDMHKHTWIDQHTYTNRPTQTHKYTNTYGHTWTTWTCKTHRRHTNKLTHTYTYTNRHTWKHKHTKTQVQREWGTNTHSTWKKWCKWSVELDKQLRLGEIW